ncbi:MAG: peptidyl-prolyl cis-trans isomerase [Geobacter sp.]|nr:MAG: peptidyl-prolyl cis-trans isomerase [Geobacter sp.]
MKAKLLATGTVAVMAGMVLWMEVPSFASEQPAPQAVAQPAKTLEPKGATPESGKAVTTKTEAAVVTQPVSDEARADGVYIHLKAPFYSPLFFDVPLASVNDEKITLGDLQKALMSVHEKMTEEKEVSAKKNFMEPLERLINVKLVVQEAKNMELDQQAEIKSNLEKFADQQLRQVLFLERVKDIKPDEKKVQKEYRDAIKEMKLKSVMFLKEKDAKAFLEELKHGKKFDELRDKVLKEGRAETVGQDERQFATNAALGPFVSAGLADVKAGATSPIIQITNGFIIAKVEEIRYVDNPEALEQARNKVLSQMKLDSLKRYKAELVKKYAKENTKLVKSLDFEAKKPGFEKFLTDKRVVMSIKGEEPIRVSDLADALNSKFFHGIENAIKEKKLNREKLLALDELESVRVFKKEALEKRLDKSEEYLKRIEDHKTSVLFGAFIEKIVKPDVTFTVAQVKDYYEKHLSDYAGPETFQIAGIAFTKKDDAQKAIDKLREGVDFAWLKNNADGQVAKNARGLLQFNDEALTLQNMPESMQKVVKGARKGDYRLYESPEGYVYALFIKEKEEAKARPLEEVKDEVGQKVAWLNTTQDIEKWFKKLREAYPVKIYLESR